MIKKTILLIEDEEDIVEIVKYSLEKENYNVVSETSGKKGFDRAIALKPDLIILDIMLPEMNGNEVCKLLKSHPAVQRIPVVFLSAKNDEIDVIDGLELGADDYIAKPFSNKILLARVRSAIRKAGMSESLNELIKIADMLVYPSKYKAVVDGKTVNLTVTETKILQLFASHAGSVFSRYQIVDAIHGNDYECSERAVDVQIAGLRKKMGESGTFIETVRGAGYRLRD